MNTDEISDVVKATLEAKILEAFKTTPEMIDELVKACLSRPVTEYGSKPDFHQRNNAIPYLTYLARSAVEQVAATAVRDYVETMAPLIKKQVQEKLSAGIMVDALTESIIKTTKNGYDVKVEFSVPEND